MTNFISINNCTIYDVCLNTYGTLDLLTKLMNDNNFPGVNYYPENGRIFTFDETLIKNENIYNQAALNNIKYATA
jgi:hypothetical protein